MTSKSPIRDYTKLIDNVRTAKKDHEFQGYSYYTDSYVSTDKIISDLKMKLQISLKHNTRLLDENSILSEMVNNLRFQLKGAQQQIGLLQTSINESLLNSQSQRSSLMQEIQLKQKLHNSQIQRLLNQISGLHSQKNSIQINKNKQIENLRDTYQKTTVNYLQNMRNAQNNAKQIYQKQIVALKQLLDRSQYQKQNIRTANKIENNKLNEKVRQLQADINHQKNLYNAQTLNLKNKFQTDLNNQKKNILREKQIQTSTYEFSIKRLRNQILQKNNQINALGRKIAQGQQAIQLQSIHLKKQKQSLLLQLSTLQIQMANSISRQKAKLNQINKQQIDNILAMNQTHISSMHGQIKRLKEIIDFKTFQLKKLIQQNSKLKETFMLQSDLTKKQNQQLKIRIKKIEADNIQQLEAFKIKMAKLFHSDTEALSSFYQNQISSLIITNKQLQKVNETTKQKLYKAILDNDQIRKTFQIQVSKQKSRVQDLKIKLASLDVEHKQQISSIGTRMNLTSQTLIRQTQQKNKTSSFFQEQKRKFQALINSKDKQLAQLLQSIYKIKKMHQSQLQVLNAQKSDLTLQNQELQIDKKRIKETYEQQLLKKQQKLKKTVDSSSKQLEQLKQLGKKNEMLQAQNIKLQKQCEHLLRQNRSMSQQLGLKKGFIQTLQMQSCAAIQDQKNKVKVTMGANQVSLKQYFEDKIQSKDKDIKTLKTLLSEKQQDIRDLIIKYNAIQKRLENLLQTQTKLIQFQQKVKSIGMDNNLVKNLAQLFRHREN